MCPPSTEQHLSRKALIGYRPKVGLIVAGDVDGLSPHSTSLSNFDHSAFLSEGECTALEGISAAFYGMHMIVLVAANSEVASNVAKILGKGTVKVAIVGPHSNSSLLRPHVNSLVATPHWNSFECICAAFFHPIANEGVCNVDFEDFRKILMRKGDSILGYGSGGDVEAATRLAIASLEAEQLNRASAVFVSIEALPGAVKVQAVKNSLAQVRWHLSPVIANDAIRHSLTPSTSNCSQISVCILATGIPQEGV